MSNSKHTPGPWTISNFTGVYDSDNKTLVAAMGTTYLSRETVEANQRLIAAAPELFACLKELLECTELNLDEVEENTLRYIEYAQQAIAKAEQGK